MCNCKIADYKSITLVEIEESYNLIQDNSCIRDIRDIMYDTTTISLKLDNNNTLEFITDEECSYKYLGYIESLNIYHLQYIDYHSEYTILIHKLNGDEWFFDGNIIFNDNNTCFIIYKSRLNNKPSTIQLYSINKELDIKLLYTYSTFIKDPIYIDFIDNKTVSLALLHDTIITKYLLKL